MDEASLKCWIFACFFLDFGFWNEVYYAKGARKYAWNFYGEGR